MKPWHHKYRFFVILGVLIVLALTSLLMIWLSQPPGERYLASRLESLLTNALSQPVKLDRLETNLFSRVEITGLRVLSSVEPDSSVIEIPSLRLRYNLVGFIASGLAIDSVLISSFHVDLEHDSLAGFNLNLLNPAASADSTKSSSQPLKLSINYISLTDGLVFFNDQEIKLSGAVHGLSSVAQLHDLSRIDFKLSAESLELTGRGHNLPLGEFFVSGDWTSPDLTLDSLSLKSSDFNVASHAAMSFVEPSPIINAHCQMDVDLLRLVYSLEALGMYSLPRLDALVGINLSITGALAELAFEVKVETDSLNWDNISTGELSVHAVGKKTPSFWTFETNTECKLLATPDTVLKAVSLAALVTISDSMTSVKDLVLTLPDLSIHGNSDFRTAGDDTRIDCSLKVKGTITDAMDIVGLFTSPVVSDFEGTADFTGKIDGSLSNPDYRVVGVLPILIRDNITITNLILKSEYRQGKLTIARFDGDLCKGRLSMEGDLVTATLQHHLALKVSNIDLFYLWSGIFETESPFEGFVNGNVVSSGILSDPSTYLITSRFALDTVEFAGAVIPPFNAVLSSDRGEIRLLFSQNDARIQAQGRMQRDSLSGNFLVYLPEMEPLAALLNLNNLSGELNIKGSISGKYSDPTIEVAMSGNRWLYRDFPIDSLSGRLSLVGGELSFGDAVIYGELDPIDPEHPPFGLSGLSGAINYTGDLQGALANPVINLTVNGSNVLYQKFYLQSGRIVIAAQNRRITLKEIQLVSDSLRLSGQGDYSIDSISGNLHLNVSESMHDSINYPSSQGILDIGFVNPEGIPQFKVSGTAIPLGALSRIIGRQDISGNFDVQLTAKLPKEIQVDKLEITIRDISVSQARLDSLVIKGSMNDKQIELTELNGYVEGNVFRAFANLTRKTQPPKNSWSHKDNLIRAGIIGTITDFAILQPFLPEGYTVGGSCDLDINLTGKLSHPRTKGYFTLREGSLRSKVDVALMDSIEAYIVFQDTLLSVNSISGIYQSVRLFANAEFTYHTSSWYNLTANIGADGHDVAHVVAEVQNDSIWVNLILKKFDLGLIEPMMPGLDAFGGIASASVKVSGAMNEPEIDGMIQFDKLYLSPTFLPDSLTNSSLMITFDRYAVDVSNFSGELGGGTVRASGRYVFDEDSAGSNLIIHIQDSRVIDTRNYLLTIKQTDLSISRSGGYALIEGNLILGDSRLLYRFTPQKVIAMLRTSEQPKAEQLTLLQKVRLDVKVHDSDNLWIDNNLARIKLKADLVLSGVLTNPVVSGRVSVVEGYALYLDRKFNVERGVLDFYNPVRINPNIDLLAQTTVESYKSRDETPHLISLSISGELDQAVITLTSDPPEDRTDILSLLTLGITRRDLTGVDGQQGDVKFQEAVRERVELISSRRVSGYVSSKVENVLGLETFTIENNLFNFGKNWGPQLVASKKLSSRTELTYTTIIGRTNDQGLKIGYMLTERFTLEGQTDQTGRAGIDLNYKIKLP